MTITASNPGFDATVRVDKIPPEGRTVSVTADEEQREALAERFKVDAVNAFSADVVAGKLRGGVRVRGEVRGEVVQPCVVTGDPVVQTIAEPVDRVFIPGRDKTDDAPAGSETWVNLEGDDIPDYFEGDEIDLSDLVMEIFALAIDLYPRAPGAELEDGQAGDAPEESSPFAALQALKRD